MKDSTLLIFFTYSGSAFHTVGAAYVNALLPKVFVFVFGTFNIDLLEDLSCLELTSTTTTTKLHISQYYVINKLRGVLFQMGIALRILTGVI